ncbi:hypothetical protein [Pseudomonas sp. AG1028]|uniref:hypothetical protein n=1 Tax=Pseudomonas sp. AG1028 TaxID=2572911 RepID=UPI0011BEDAE3|nr:hypothetical protein [Pseudomonas sp. AG1028]
MRQRSLVAGELPAALLDMIINLLFTIIEQVHLLHYRLCHTTAARAGCGNSVTNADGLTP